MYRRPPRSPLFPYTPLSRSRPARIGQVADQQHRCVAEVGQPRPQLRTDGEPLPHAGEPEGAVPAGSAGGPDRKSTRLNSSHANISYAVFCLKKKNKTTNDNS